MERRAHQYSARQVLRPHEVLRSPPLQWSRCSCRCGFTDHPDDARGITWRCCHPLPITTLNRCITPSHDPPSTPAVMTFNPHHPPPRLGPISSWTSTSSTSQMCRWWCARGGCGCHCRSWGEFGMRVACPPLEWWWPTWNPAPSAISTFACESTGGIGQDADDLINRLSLASKDHLTLPSHHPVAIQRSNALAIFAGYSRAISRANREWRRGSARLACLTYAHTHALQEDRFIIIIIIYDHTVYLSMQHVRVQPDLRRRRQPHRLQPTPPSARRCSLTAYVDLHQHMPGAGHPFWRPPHDLSAYGVTRQADSEYGGRSRRAAALAAGVR